MKRQNRIEHTLHTLNKTDNAVSLNLQLSECIREGDSVVLIEDGVYQCLTLGTQTANHWAESALKIYVLRPDAEARGIQIDEIQQPKIALIDYQDFVQLTLKYKKVVSWY